MSYAFLLLVQPGTTGGIAANSSNGEHNIVFSNMI